MVPLIFGEAALVGIWVVGLFVDRCLRRLVLVSLSIFGLASLALTAQGQDQS